MKSYEAKSVIFGDFGAFWGFLTLSLLCRGTNKRQELVGFVILVKSDVWFKS